MTIKKVVARTNDPWQNLHILRKLKKKYKAKYTVGLINADSESFYKVIDGKIHTVSKRHASGDIKSDFDFNKYFKGHRGYITKGDTVYFTSLKLSEGFDYCLYSQIKAGKGTFVDKIHHDDTFDYGIIQTEEGMYMARVYTKTKEELLRFIKKIVDNKIERMEYDIKTCKDKYQYFIKQVEEIE